MCLRASVPTERERKRLTHFMFQQSSIKLEKTRSNLLKQRAKNDEKQKKREKNKMIAWSPRIPYRMPYD